MRKVPSRGGGGLSGLIRNLSWGGSFGGGLDDLEYEAEEEERQAMNHYMGREWQRHSTKLTSHEENARARMLKMAAKAASSVLLEEETRLQLETHQDDAERITVLYAKEKEDFAFVRWPKLHQAWLDAKGKILIRSEEQRSAGFVELFYDLIFVVILASISHDARTGFTLRFAVDSLVVTRLWKDTTAYLNRFDAEDMLHKVALYFLMLGVLGLHVGRTASDNIGVARVFAASFLWVRFCLILLHLWVMLIPEARVFCSMLVAQFVLTSTLWIGSCFAPDQLTRSLLWLAAIILDYALDVVRSLQYFKPLPLNIEHVGERYGLFLIIVIGEGVVSSAFTERGNFAILQYIAGALVLLLAFAFQELYHDCENGFHGIPRRHHAVRAHKFFGWLWSTSHQPLTLALLTTAAATSNMITFYGGANGILRAAGGDGSGSDLASATRLDETSIWEFCGGLGASLFFMSMIGYSHDTYEDAVRVPKTWRVFIRCAVCLFIVLLGLVDFFRDEPLVLLGLGVAVTIGVIALEMERRTHQADAGPTDDVAERALSQQDGIYGL